MPRRKKPRKAQKIFRSEMAAKESVLSGLFAACAAALGKIAFSNDSLIVNVVATVFGSFGSTYCILIGLVCRAIVLAMMMGSNALMIACFLSALEKENSTLMVTAISTAVNFVATGLVGNVLFSEKVSNLWYFGAIVTSCIMWCCPDILQPIFFSRAFKAHLNDLFSSHYLLKMQQIRFVWLFFNNCAMLN